MATLVWDQAEERIFHSGVDHGVLYIHGGKSVPWNGIVGVEESTSSEIKASYLDGVKYLEVLVPGDFAGKLKAFTYPEEFDSVSGIAELASGFQIHDQPSKSFDLSYRTLVGNALEGTSLGYIIHLFYNINANPDPVQHNTLNDSPGSSEFSWSLSGTPPTIRTVRPTVHISIDSRTTDPDILALIEQTLYGSQFSEATLPSIQEIAEYFGYLGALIIIDHGDGTWSAIDESEAYIIMQNSTTFTIENADAEFINDDTFTISSTNVNAL